MSVFIVVMENDSNEDILLVCSTPRHERFRISVGREPPPPPRKKPVRTVTGKRREAPTSFYLPEDLESIFAVAMAPHHSFSTKLN